MLRGHCEAVGRDYDEIVKTWSAEVVAVAPTRAEAERIALASPYYNPQGAIVGTPEEVADQLRIYTDLGVEYLIVRCLDFPRTEGIELFCHEVMPLL
ncbi:MAG: hypothetical protein HC802_16445 [Caldilineaceae bacterium]|nr:hypothetical protein [Caldilineaceae bacterium]